jgi:hypothetical protein
VASICAAPCVEALYNACLDGDAAAIARLLPAGATCDLDLSGRAGNILLATHRMNFNSRNEGSKRVR